MGFGVAWSWIPRAAEGGGEKRFVVAKGASPKILARGSYLRIPIGHKNSPLHKAAAGSRYNLILITVIDCLTMRATQCLAACLIRGTRRISGRG